MLPPSPPDFNPPGFDNIQEAVRILPHSIEEFICPFLGELLRAATLFHFPPEFASEFISRNFLLKSGSFECVIESHDTKCRPNERPRRRVSMA